MADQVTRAEFEKYRAQTQETLLRLAGEIKRLEKQLGDLNDEVEALRSQK